MRCRDGGKAIGCCWLLGSPELSRLQSERQRVEGSLCPGCTLASATAGTDRSIGRGHRVGLAMRSRSILACVLLRMVVWIEKQKER